MVEWRTPRALAVSPAGMWRNSLHSSCCSGHSGCVNVCVCVLPLSRASSQPNRFGNGWRRGDIGLEKGKGYKSLTEALQSPSRGFMMFNGQIIKKRGGEKKQKTTYEIVLLFSESFLLDCVCFSPHGSAARLMVNSGLCVCRFFFSSCRIKKQIKQVEKGGQEALIDNPSIR